MGAYGWRQSRCTSYLTSICDDETRRLHFHHTSPVKVSVLGGVTFGSDHETDTWNATTRVSLPGSRHKSLGSLHYSKLFRGCLTRTSRRLQAIHTRAYELCMALRETRERARSIPADKWFCPFQGTCQPNLSSTLINWSGTGATAKVHGPVALKGTVLERNQGDTVSPF